MNDKLDHFVLEYDDERGLALLAMTETGGGRVADGECLPYAVARGYEADSRTWESIDDDEFITLRWRRKDIADSLESDWGNFGFPIPATEENVDSAIDQLGNHIDDTIYSQGWGAIHDCLDPNSFDLEVGHSKQAIEFYEQV